MRLKKKNPNANSVSIINNMRIEEKATHSLFDKYKLVDLKTPNKVKMKTKNDIKTDRIVQKSILKPVKSKEF